MKLHNLSICTNSPRFNPEYTIQSLRLNHLHLSVNQILVIWRVRGEIFHAKTALGQWKPEALYLVGCCVAACCVTHFSDATSGNRWPSAMWACQGFKSWWGLTEHMLSLYNPVNLNAYQTRPLRAVLTPVFIFSAQYLDRFFYSSAYLGGIIVGVRQWGELWVVAISARGVILKASCYTALTISLTPCDDNISSSLYIEVQHGLHVLWRFDVSKQGKLRIGQKKVAVPKLPHIAKIMWQQTMWSDFPLLQTLKIR